MTKRRMSKASKRRLTLFGTLSLIAIGYFCFSLFYNGYTIYKLNAEKKSLEKLYNGLQDEAETLKIDIEKLNDSKYLADYAREHYLYSKDGEYIIVDRDEFNNVEDIIEDDINKNYLIIGLSVIMAFIFIYIIFKGRKRKKK